MLTTTVVWTAGQGDYWAIRFAVNKVFRKAPLESCGWLAKLYYVIPLPINSMENTSDMIKSIYDERHPSAEVISSESNFFVRFSKDLPLSTFSMKYSPAL